MANPRVECRVSEDVKRLLEQRAEQDGISPSDLMRDALVQYLYGGTQSTLQGPDAGFIAARKQAHRIAMAAIAYAFEQMPESFEDAKAWADDIILRHQLK